MTAPDSHPRPAPAACPRCRTDNPPSHRFCVECGQALPTSCPRCGVAHEPGARFCGGCGQAIGVAVAGERFASPDAYTPPHLAEKIRTWTSCVTAAREAHRLAAEHEEKGYAAGALRMLGEAAAQSGGAEAVKAAGLYAEALTAARALGMRPLEALCELELGSLARGVGDGGPAKDRLTVATTLLREMDTGHWLIQAQEALAAL